MSMCTSVWFTALLIATLNCDLACMYVGKYVCKYMRVHN